MPLTLITHPSLQSLSHSSQTWPLCPSTSPRPWSSPLRKCHPLLPQNHHSPSLNRLLWQICSITPNGSHILSPLTPLSPPLTWSNIPTTRSPPTSPKGWQLPLKSDLRSIKSRRITSTVASSDWKIGSNTTRRPSIHLQRGTSRIMGITHPLSFQDQARFFDPLNGSRKSDKDKSPCLPKEKVLPSPPSLPTSTLNPSSSMTLPPSLCPLGSASYLWDWGHPSTPSFAPSLTYPSGGFTPTRFDSATTMTKLQSSMPSSTTLKRALKMRSLPTLSPNHALKWHTPQNTFPILKPWRWGAMSPFVMAAGRKHPRLPKIKDDLPEQRSDVTSTWSKKWDQGKFGNRAIEVQEFRGFGMGLGSGVAPPGMQM